MEIDWQNWKDTTHKKERFLTEDYFKTRHKKKKKVNYKEKQKARAIFKRLKAGLVTWEELKEEELKLLKKYYPFLFR